MALCTTRNINSHLFIEASAGTGKTYTIERLVIQRLLEPFEDGSFAHISQIAVMTFTKAAARELSTRIKKAIMAAVEQESGEKKRLLERAQAEFEKASISTIHGFCFFLLSDYAKASNASFGELITQEMLFCMVKDFLEVGLKSDPLSTAQMMVVLDHAHCNFEAIAKEITLQLCHGWMELEPLIENEELVAKLQKELSHSTVDVLQELEVLAASFTGCLRKDGSIKEPLFRSFLAYREASLPPYNILPLIHYPLYASEVFCSLKKGATYSGNLLEQLFAVEPLLRSLASKEAIIKRITKQCKDFVCRQMKKKRLYSFDELLVQMDHALDDPKFQEFIRDRFRFVVVDEFQDTDPLQWRILQKGFLQNGSSVVLVGDPKQAIYSFRKADVYSFLEAKEALCAKSVETLGTNFRATHSMVKAINTLFCGKQKEALFFLPKLQASLAVSESSSSKPEEPFLPAVHFFIVEASIGRKRLWPTEEIEEEKLFPFIVEEISKLQGPFKRYAILVRDRFQAERVSLFLKKWNIPTTFWKRPSVLGSPAHKLLERFISLLMEPRNREKLTLFLSHEPFLYGEEKLKMDRHSCARFVEELVSLKRYEHSFTRLMDAFLRSSWDGYTLEEWIAGRENGRQMLRDLESLFDIIVQKFDGLNCQESIAKLRQIPTEEYDLYPTRWERSEDGVVVITLHSSKGLEFDVVFALAAATRVPPEEASDEYEAEKIRQLYVACTRAKSLLFLPVLIDQDKKIPPKGSFSPLERYFAIVQQDLGMHSLEDTLEFLVQSSEGTIVCIRKEPCLPEKCLEHTLPYMPVDSFAHAPIHVLKEIPSFEKPQEEKKLVIEHSSMGMALAKYLTSDEEVQAAIAYISDAFQEGQLFVEYSEMLAEKLRNGLHKIKEGRLLDEGFIHVEENRYYLAKAWKLERAVDFQFARIEHALSSSTFDIERAKKKLFELQAEGKLYEDQRKAIECALESPIFCIWGGPGTGKSYTARYLLEVFLHAIAPKPARVAIAAPTGKASRLLARDLDFDFVDIKTLHALLEIGPSGKMAKKSSMLAYDLFIIDESSMMDLLLCERLLSRVAEGSRVVFLGDPCQLAPIEPGMPFVSFVERQKGRGRLTSCRRTELAPILELAHAVNEGDARRALETIRKNQDILSFMPLDERSLSEVIEEHVKRLYTESTSIQMLSALRLGRFGTAQVNEWVYEASLRYAKKRNIPLFTPIVITENDYSLGLFNGDLGSLLPDGRVYFPSLAEPIDKVLLGPHELAYCLSVHKSQGSEFDFVTLLLAPGLQRFDKKLLYTAITRAKKRLTILSSEETFKTQVAPICL
jgi:exodeoxyribonuclease V beta subunit